MGQLVVAVGFHVVVDAAGYGVALVVDVGAVRRRAQLVGRLVLVLHDEEVLVAIVGNVGAEGIQALELLHHVVGLRLADDGRPVLVPNMVGHMGQGLDLFVALDLSKCNAHECILPRCDKTFRKNGHKIAPILCKGNAAIVMLRRSVTGRAGICFRPVTRNGRQC